MGTTWWRGTVTPAWLTGFVWSDMAKRKPIYPDPIRIDLACGQRKKDGFWGVDYKKCDGVDEVVDLLRFPWPWADECVEEVHCSHFIEHIPQVYWNAAKPTLTILPQSDESVDLLSRFWMELYRVMKIGGTATIVAPYAHSDRCHQDPTHRRGIVPATFLYANRKWMNDNGLSHYGIRANFKFGYGFSINWAFASRPQETQGFAATHYVNGADDVHGTLIKLAWDDLQ